jgi:hypothetical protein
MWLWKYLWFCIFTSSKVVIGAGLAGPWGSAPCQMLTLCSSTPVGPIIGKIGSKVKDG